MAINIFSWLYWRSNWSINIYWVLFYFLCGVGNNSTNNPHNPHKSPTDRKKQEWAKDQQIKQDKLFQPTEKKQQQQQPLTSYVQ